MIAGMSLNRGIGLKNKLPWHFSEDLRYFSKITKGNGNNAIIMGKNTWNSLNQKALPGRTNIVLSSTLNHVLEKAVLLKSISEATTFCLECKFDTVWVIGGSQIYNQFLNTELIDECHLSIINKDYECDTFFPKFDDNWYQANLVKIKEEKGGKDDNKFSPKIEVVIMKKKT